MSEKKSFFNFGFKDLVYVLIIGAVLFFGWRAYKDLRMEVERTNIAYNQLSDSLARAQSELVTKAELKDMAKELGLDLKKILADLKDLDADIKAVGETVASIEGEIQEDQGSDDSVPHDPPTQPDECKLCDLHGYTGAVQAKDITLGDMPHARVEFDASQAKPWTLKYDDIDVKVHTVVGEQDKEGGHLLFYHTIALENKSRPELAGKEYKLKITSSEFKQTVDSSKEFYWWAPHLDISLDNTFSLSGGELYRFGGSLGFSVMAYGRTLNDNDWRFIRLGVGMNTQENPYVMVEPVRYNLGRHIPIVSDLWIGAGAFYDGSWGVSLSIGTTL